EEGSEGAAAERRKQIAVRGARRTASASRCAAWLGRLDRFLQRAHYEVVQARWFLCRRFSDRGVQLRGGAGPELPGVRLAGLFTLSCAQLEIEIDRFLHVPAELRDAPPLEAEYIGRVDDSAVEDIVVEANGGHVSTISQQHVPCHP